MKKCCCPNPTPVYHHRSWHWWHWVPVTWSALADVKCTVNMSKCRGRAGTLTCFVSREALSSDFQTQFHQDWQNDRVFFWFLIIYFRLTYTFFFFFYSESYYGASLANVSICFEDTDKSIIPLHSHTTVITFLTIASENPYHKVSELYLVKFKRLGQTKSLPQILTCHQHHESCFKQRGALHAEDQTHFLSYTDLILLTNKYIPNSSWRVSDDPLDLPLWLPPSLSAAPIIDTEIWSLELLTLGTKQTANLLPAKTPHDLKVQRAGFLIIYGHKCKKIYTKPAVYNSCCV